MSVTTRLKDRDLTQYTTAQLQAGKAYILTTQAGMSPADGQIIVWFVASGQNGDVVVNLLNGDASPRPMMDQTLLWYEANLDIVIDINPGSGAQAFSLGQAVGLASAGGKSDGNGAVSGIGLSTAAYVEELLAIPKIDARDRLRGLSDADLDTLAGYADIDVEVLSLVLDEQRARRS